MKQVQAYQTADNRTFTDKVDALVHECKLEVRGLMNKVNPKQAAYSSQEVSDMLVNHREEFQAITKKYNTQINRIKGARSACPVE